MNISPYTFFLSFCCGYCPTILCVCQFCYDDAVVVMSFHGRAGDTILPLCVGASILTVLSVVVAGGRWLLVMVAVGVVGAHWCYMLCG